MHGGRSLCLISTRNTLTGVCILIERMGLINCDTQKVLFKSEGLSTAAVAFIRLSMRQVGHQSELVP